MSDALRIAFVGVCVAATVALITWWCAPALATGDRVMLAGYVLWISTWSSGAALAALGVWEWVSQRGEEVIDLKS